MSTEQVTLSSVPLSSLLSTSLSSFNFGVYGLRSGLGLQGCYWGEGDGCLRDGTIAFCCAAVFFTIWMQGINFMALCRMRGMFIAILLSIAWTIHCIRYLNQALTPTPGPSTPSAACHHPSGINTLSPAATLTWHAPGMENAFSSCSLHFCIVPWGRSCTSSFGDTPDIIRETGTGIWDVLACRGIGDRSR